ncbi:NADH dehydrogenase [ubiquinone] 1 alpha subcomplex assembly factor [Fasciolopsis buskii]|uniref:NADH dehydrogenase [ubiquinone] 1 alpha subcomplex assembly factor n=1 Tax=Fasciolopsis buskii TaxID=27845 RepID=A0A8E0VHN2_9TREM|nr:NADH dehydrogenase [ubiquinone] 1 alpha subcomplex assembly factor [Fasciolopsis buski]
MNCNPCVVVHAGAGYHSKSNESAYNKLCQEACKVAASVLLDNGKGAVNAASAAVAYLENSSLTNAGFGSNLTYDGLVECDAGMMCGSSLRFAGVGAVSHIQNPIYAAELLLEEQLRGSHTTLGRIQPCVMFGSGARRWALEKDPSRFPESDLISEKSLSDWIKYREWLMDSEAQKPKDGEPQICNVPKKRSRKIGEQSKLDTVGAVCLDNSGNIAAAVSSGGVALKHEGRIGQACVYGCGCWAEQDDHGSAVGVVTSGTGEQLIRTQLAQRTAEQILANRSNPLPDVLETVINDKFLGSRLLAQDEYRYAGFAGIYSVSTESSRNVEIFFGHTTRSMSIAYFIPRTMSAPLTTMSRKSCDRPHRLEVFSRSLNLRIVQT